MRYQLENATEVLHKKTIKYLNDQQFELYVDLISNSELCNWIPAGLQVILLAAVAVLFLRKNPPI